jgi:hypothetical protein
MLNSVHSGCSCFIERAFSSRFLVLGSITVLSWGQLNAIGSEGSPNNEGPLSRRFRSLPLPPEVSKEPLKDPAIVAQENLTAACIKLKSSLENSYNPLPLVDWLNVSNLPSFFEPTIRSLMKREEYFNAIDSLGKYDLAAQPYGFYSNYKLGKKNFKLTTFGVTIDGGITLDERWIVGGGLGYSHSMLDWDSNKHTVNSLYFGPYVGYIFEQAYIDFSLIGVYNYYNINHLFAHSKEENAHDGWDAAARLEGG